MRRKTTALILAALLVVPHTACGTLFYSERQNQGREGKVDPNIVILDGIGLLFFILPGLLAFGLDFYTETIYLPAGVEKGEGPFIHDEHEL